LKFKTSTSREIKQDNQGMQVGYREGDYPRKGKRASEETMPDRSVAATKRGGSRPYSSFEIRWIPSPSACWIICPAQDDSTIGSFLGQH